MNKPIDVEEVKQYIESCGPDTKIYFGCDSERFKRQGKWYADYMLAIVVHIDGKSGCKIFGEVQREFDYDSKKDKPRMRLMNEVMKVADLYLRMGDFLEDRNVEIHIDVNPDMKHGSSCVINEAVGYIKAMCNVVPMVKPESPAASFCADRLKDIMSQRVA